MDFIIPENEIVEYQLDEIKVKIKYKKNEQTRMETFQVGVRKQNGTRMENGAGTILNVEHRNRRPVCFTYRLSEPSRRMSIYYMICLRSALGNSVELNNNTI